jgi:glycosyltransferase involved in cell wall biosynthesis
MRVVIINETFSPNMGYLGTMLPKYLSRFGVEVHVLATDLPAYHGLDEFRNGTPNFLREQSFPAGTMRQVDGYTVHIQAHSRLFGHVRMKQLRQKLVQLKPDVVYCVLAIGWMPLESALLKLWAHYKLFTGSHTTMLAFESTKPNREPFSYRFRQFAMRWLPGRFVSLFTQKCYCPTSDSAEVAVQHFGVQKSKTEVVYLGVDRELFFPIETESDRESRRSIRCELKVAEADVVCIYTGKMTEAKNPLLLARAIARMRLEGRSYLGLFIGDGAQRARIAQSEACTVMGFMDFNLLGPYYRASDIAVWPTSESTSMLDAVACGLPIVVSDRIYQDHVSGNGLAYYMNDLESLCNALRQLDDPKRRRALGEVGAKKMREHFTWDIAARKRFEDFSAALPLRSIGSQRS